jgi:metal-responsive CopG/Arc/MetJ family transcriptional regulator
MKTAISIPDDIFREIEKFAEEHKCSRSEVFVIAIKEFLTKLESRKLLNALNEAYSIAESKEEKTVRAKARKHYVRKVLKERY